MAGLPQPQPQAPPQQPPPTGAGVAARPPSEIVESSLTVSEWPCGQSAGSDDALIGRSTSKVVAHSRQRNS